MIIRIFSKSSHTIWTRLSQYLIVLSNRNVSTHSHYRAGHRRNVVADRRVKRRPPASRLLENIQHSKGSLPAELRDPGARGARDLIFRAVAALHQQCVRDRRRLVYGSGTCAPSSPSPVLNCLLQVRNLTSEDDLFEHTRLMNCVVTLERFSRVPSPNESERAEETRRF